MRNRPNITTQFGTIAYQHVSNGGVSFALSTDTFDSGLVEHHLEIGLSNHGVNQRCIIPIFATTPTILRKLADELEAQNIRDPKYLNPIIAHITADDKEDVYFRVVAGKVVQVTREECYGPAEGSQVGNVGNTSQG